MTNLVIIHGTCGSPEGNWFPWLKTQIETKGLQVICPRFPTPEGQNLAAWEKVFSQETASLSPNETILVGHSLGAIFSARMAARTATPYKALFGAAPFAARLGLPDFDRLNADFVDPPMDWEKARAGARHRSLYRGSNDPYVPASLSESFADKLAAPLTVIENGGHLNAESGFTSCPFLVTELSAFL